MAVSKIGAAVALLWSRSLPLALGKIPEEWRDHANKIFSDAYKTSMEDESLTPEQIVKLHKRFDSSNDGRASLKELMQFAKSTKEDIWQREIHEMIEEVDTNKDGKVSLEEYMTFEDLYTNQTDGGDETEMKQLEARKQVETNKFRAADKDRDGLLGGEELTGLFYPETDHAVLQITAQQTMKQRDTDGNGLLTPKEFWAIESAEADAEEYADFAKLDLNGDGDLDVNELSGEMDLNAMKTLIVIADKDHDMHVSAEELAAVGDEIAKSDAHYHLVEWKDHFEWKEHFEL